MAIKLKDSNGVQKVLDISSGGTGANNASDAVGNLGINDFVIETGTDGIWTYRKWASGTAECWGNGTFTDACNTSWGALYESGSHYYSYPSGLFYVQPTYSIVAHGTSQSAALLEVSTGGDKTRTPNFFVVRPTAVASQSWTCHIYAIGRWQ